MDPGRTSGGTHTKLAIGAAFWSAINSLIPILISLAVFVITARRLTPYDLGIVAFATGLGLIGSALCPGGLGEAIIQRLETSERQLSSVFWLCMGSGIAVYGLECACAPALATFFKMRVLAALIPVISTRILADMAAVVPNALLARNMSFKIIAMRTFCVSLIAAAITLGLLFAGLGIWAIVASQIATSYVTMFVGFFAIKWRPRYIFSVAALRELLGYGLFSTGTQMLQKVFQQNEQILVGLFLGTTQLGFYNFSKQILNVFNNVVAGSLGAVAHPMFSGIQNDIIRVRKGFLSATFFSSLVAFPMFIGLAVVAPRIVPIAFGERWLSAVPLVQLQCFVGLSTCIGTIQFGLITSQGKASWWFYYQLLQTITTALVIIIFARFGLLVMLWAIVIKGYVFWFIPGRSSLKLLSMSFKDYILNFRTPATAAVFMGFAILIINSVVLSSLTNIEVVLLNIVVGALIYGLIVFAMDARRIREFIALVAPKFKKPLKLA